MTEEGVACVNDDNGTDMKKRIKVTVVGDSGVGKTCLLMTFANKQFPEESVCGQSLFENSSGTIKAGSEGSFEVPVDMATDDGPVELGLTDTIGTISKEVYATSVDPDQTENYRPIREIFAAKTDVFLVCFSVTDPESLENVRNSWLTEIRILTPKAPFLLVGTKTDLREDPDTLKSLADNGKEPVSLLNGIKLAKTFGAKEYVECSSLNMVSVKSVFGAVVLVTEQEEGKSKPGYKRKSVASCCVS